MATKYVRASTRYRAALKKADTYLKAIQTYPQYAEAHRKVNGQILAARQTIEYALTGRLDLHPRNPKGE